MKHSSRNCEAASWAKLRSEEGLSNDIRINVGDRGVPGSTWFFSQILWNNKGVASQSYLPYSYLFILGVGSSVSTWVNDTQVMVAISVAIYSYRTMYNQNTLQCPMVSFHNSWEARIRKFWFDCSQSHRNEWPIWTELLLRMAECPQTTINRSTWHTHPFIWNIHAFDCTSPNGTHHS